MKLYQLDEYLNNALEEFKDEWKFNLETHEGKYLTKDDLDTMGQQFYYCLSSFKQHIMAYLKDR